MDAIPAEVSGPIRRNAMNRERVPARDMIRYVADTEGRIVPDVAGKLPGRGVWLEASRDAVMLATRKNLFARELRRKAIADGGLADLVERLLVQACLQQLSLARRAGQLVIGFDQVRPTLSSAARGVLIMSVDAAGDARKLRQIGDGSIVIEAFARQEIGRQVGRDELVYAWMEEGAIAMRLVALVRKLRGFRDVEMVIPDTWALRGEQCRQRKGSHGRNE